MTKRERVYNALMHKAIDKIPKGELAIDAGLANKLLGGGYSEEFQNFEREKAVRELLNIDYINVGDWPSFCVGQDGKGNSIFQSAYGEQYVFNGKSKHTIKTPFEEIEDAIHYKTPDISKVSGALITKFAEQTDLFVFAQVGGPISMVNEMIGMEDYLVYSLTNTEEIRVLAERIMEFEVLKARLFIDSGANAILMADDMAFNTGLLLPPHIMEQVAFPFYEKAIKDIKAYKDVPIVLHTDGYILNAMDRIVEVGFNGIHSLQPSAGMDILTVKEKYGDKLCLVGNIDLDYVMSFGSEDEVRENVYGTIQIASKNSGFILSTCNILVDVIPPKNVLAMYNTAENFVI